MSHSTRWLATTAVLAGLGVSACGSSSAFDSAPAQDQGPSRLRSVRGSAMPQVILTAPAARRIGIRTAPVRNVVPRNGAGGRDPAVIPYAAVIYDAEGHTFAYTNPRPLVYVRRQIEIDRIAGRLAFLRKGPPRGTPVVTVGAQELLGVEYGVEAD